jgi:hypothetical protein
LNEKEFNRSKADQLKLKLKSFPDDFIQISGGKKVKLPPHALLLGKEFFGNIEVTAADGSPWYISNDITEAKYIVYSRQNGKSEIIIPENSVAKSAVSDYENYLDFLMKEIGQDFSSKFPEGEKTSAVAEVFRLLNLVRY